MFRDATAQSVFSGSLAAFVGFASSFAVVLAGLKGVGATDAQAALGMSAAAVAMGLSSIVLALKTKLPMGGAWSTPGAALLASAAVPAGGFPAAGGAFLVCGALLVLAGLFKPFGRAVAAIPGPLANALLAGVLLQLCLAPIQAIAFDWTLGLPILLAWIIMQRFNKALAVPAALVAFGAVVVFGVTFPAGWQSALGDALLPDIALVAPVFEPAAILGIALPLFVVTMASQNIPGIAVLKAYGYEPDPGPAIATTGVFSAIFAPLGSHAVNLSAIVAAMMASEEAGPDPKKRYVAAAVFGIGSVLFGLFAGVAAAFVSLAPPVLIKAVAGLALVGAFSASAMAAFADERLRPAAAVTFLAGASGLSLLGISGAFWGLIVGLLMVGLLKRDTT